MRKGGSTAEDISGMRLRVRGQEVVPRRGEAGAGFWGAGGQYFRLSPLLSCPL